MAMEIARHWRLSSSRKQDTPEIKLNAESGGIIRMWGGEIPYRGIEDLKLRLENRGFKEVEVEKILTFFDETITAEAAIPNSEVVESFLELIGTKVGKESRSEV